MIRKQWRENFGAKKKQKNPISMERFRLNKITVFWREYLTPKNLHRLTLFYEDGGIRRYRIIIFAGNI